MFGDPRRVAIEYELDDNHGGVWLFGRACYWFCGQRVGDYDDTCTLRDIMWDWSRISCDAGKRCNARLKALDAQDLVRTLHSGLIGHDDDWEVNFRLGIEEQWANHNIGPGVYGFVNWNIYLVEDASTARVVYQFHGSPVCEECKLKPGEFDRVLRLAVDSLFELYVGEGGKL